jgi:hypothetical protein
VGPAISSDRFRHHFSHTWLDRGGAERDLTELNGWTSPQMLTRYGASARGRRSYDYRGMCGRRVRVFAIDLVPDLVRTGRAHEEVERSRPGNRRAVGWLATGVPEVLERNPGGGVGSGRRCS